MKTLLLIIFIHTGLYICSSNGQAITLQKSNVPILAGKVHNHTAALTGFTVPKADTNHAWNYAGLVSTGNADVNFISNPFGGFTTSSTAIADTGKTEQLTSTSIVRTHLIYDEDTTGFFMAGNYVKAQNYSLANYFGKKTDNLQVPLQNDFCKVRLLTFPDTFKSGNHNKAVRTLNFFLTIDTLGYKDVPGRKTTSFDYRDTTVGWGTLRIPSPNKASKPYPVLLIRRRMVTIDSFFLVKTPIAPIILNALGEKQGVKTVSYQESFYRAGYMSPMMTINFGTDSTYKTPTSVLYTTDSITSGIKESELAIQDFGLFPNPVSGNDVVHCRFSKNSPGHWQIKIINTMGQVIVNRDINNNGNNDEQIAAGIFKNSGVYFVNIINAQGENIANGKIMVTK